jgi:hypothetical protein
MKNGINLNYQKEGQDYFLRAKGKDLAIYEFILVKQGREGYSIMANKWINNNMHTQSIELSQDTMSVKNAKQLIYNFLNN